jgi:hypothetical protein
MTARCWPPLDADLGDALATGLLGPAPENLAAFERAFIEHVERSAPDREQAWDRFYDATLSRVTRAWGRQLPGTGTVATFTRIWSRAAALSRGDSALDLGTCFGFLPLAWSMQRGAPLLLAADLSPACAALLGRQARRLGRDVGVVCADGGRLPLGDRAVATVQLLHVLEHLSAPLGDAVLHEALRVADRRIIVAVPVEPEPNPVFGHLRVFDLPRLAALGHRSGWRVCLSESDGAWLILDRP